MRSHSFVLLLLPLVGSGLVGCGDDAKTAVDAPKVDAAPNPDAPPPEVADTTWEESGAAWLEYQTIFTGVGTQNVQARLTTYYFKSMTPNPALPNGYPFPTNPGCTKTGMADLPDDSNITFPFGMGTGSPAMHTYLDVGTPIVTGGLQQATIPLGANPGFDGFRRKHDGIYHFAAFANMGDVILSATDAFYTLVLTGSSEWPAQVYTDAFYQSPPWTIGSPAFGPSQLIADTPFVETWTTPNAPTRRPAAVGADKSMSMNMLTAIIIPALGPVVVCLNDNPFGSTQLTIPADMVNYARSLGSSGALARAIVTHRLQEMTDGVTHNRKRMDFVTTWCYVTPWTAP